MRFRLSLFALLALMVAIGCNDDENNGPDNILNYDGDNASGPELNAGFHEAAARFTEAETSRFAGRVLEEINWFNGPVAPASCAVRVYGPGAGDEPGALLYSADVTDVLRTLSWNRHRLSTPIDITGEELWISIAFTHNVLQQSIGCDSGPNDPNGDWLFSAITQEWRRYSAYTPERINWNIRGVIAD